MVTSQIGYRVRYLMSMSIYIASHSASNALRAPSTAETDMRLKEAIDAGDVEVWIFNT